MKRYILPVLFIAFLFVVSVFILKLKPSGALEPPASTKNPQSIQPAGQPDASISGVFEGITPCDPEKRPLPQVPSNTKCELAIWHITFNPDSTYILDSWYGMTQPGTTGIKGGGVKITMQGPWKAVRATPTGTGATIIQLNPDDPQTSVSFLKVSDSLLHLLDSGSNMMVGNGGWSYTLNKTRTDDLLDHRTPQPSPPGSSSSGVFEGRTPCRGFLVEFTNVPVSGCEKIKWRLTLYHDPQTGTPSGYAFYGTNDTHAGKWKVIKGTQSDPEATVIQLNPDKTGQIVSLLKVDANHLYFLDEDLNILVGNKLWSYTLSRVDIP